MYATVNDRERDETGVPPTEEELENEDRPTESQPEEESEDSFPASDPPSF